MTTWNYSYIKELAGAEGLRVSDLIALAPQNDPFYTGTASDIECAAWFADLWERFGYYRGVHIRRVHYQIISQDPPVMMPDGTPYENTERCWGFLNKASKAARYLNLVDAGAFVDRRNPEPRIYLQNGDADPTLGVSGQLWGDDIRLPNFPTIPAYYVDGYNGRQGYHCEVWCEKSTMNDVLIPLCQTYGANLVTGVGELSVTACLDLVQRVNGRPVRIFYVSDFDPAGQSMPVAVGRKVEYFLRSEDAGADVRLYPIVLTADQVRQYRLPRTPIKETERRAGRFEERFGEGAVELDALEALHPGALSNIVEAQIRRYYDAELNRRVGAARARLLDDARRTQQAIIAEHRAELDQLRADYDALRTEFGERAASLQTRLSELWETITEELEDAAPDLADYPIPAANAAQEAPGALFDSGRDYVEQIAAYKAFQGKELPA